MNRIAAIVAAAGMGTRMGPGTPKQLQELDGVPILIFTLCRLAASPLITEFWIASRQGDVEALTERVRQERLDRPVQVVAGGETRQESVGRALAMISGDVELVLVQDAVRPFVNREMVERVVAEARSCGAAIVGMPAIDTVKEVKRASLPEDAALITATIPRERIVLAQTPQVFSTGLLREAFAQAERDGITASDEAAMVERLGHDVHVVLGSERNLKITRPADMELARFYLERERSSQ
ncbi:MAG TPA: 2-C-methyl-D-erythritol 4-phosphate cytidylyltransferase [Candidatus Dormibacteraeota bacterium]|nr:2-C-methyl-D-erythritol 4-phosphate cytidylyltransferase [Candidatus Dormibacteraeota bacterium]